MEQTYNQDNPYLFVHPPARPQFREPRRSDITGAIAVHTAENDPDLILPDGGAEAVAGFISRRTDAAGSYHSIVDSDSCVDVGKFGWEMFGEGTGGNRYALHLSFACHAAQWEEGGLPDQWRHGAIRQGAQAACRMAVYAQSLRGIIIPARRISATEYRNGVAGFIPHGDIDPNRRSDPGAEFPWDHFLDSYEEHMVAINTPDDTDRPTRYTSITLDDARAELNNLYRAYTGTGPTAGELAAWTQDLARRIYWYGEDPFFTLQFIEWKLHEQTRLN